MAKQVGVAALEIGVFDVFNCTMSSLKKKVFWLMNSKEKNAQKGDFKSQFGERCYLNKALNPEVFE